MTWRLRCETCGHVGDRTFVDVDGELVDALNGSVTPFACACSRCGGNALMPIRETPALEGTEAQ